jgi:hypothetical protein
MQTKDLTEREPHKQIIAGLTPWIEEGDPLVPEDAIWSHVDADDDEARDRLKEALSELISAGIVAERHNPHTGYRLLGLTEYVEKDEEEYDQLKTSVFTKAEARGLSAKWRRGDGWRLIDASGETVAVGNMRELREYLDAA